jgi:hypothetical protein
VAISRHLSSKATVHDLDSGERMSEIAEILADGLMRLEARKSSRKPADFGESSLHFSPNQSGGVRPHSAEASHD